MRTAEYAYGVVAVPMPPWHCLDMDNLSRIREAKGLTQTQLAQKIGANQATISKMESGQGNPTLSMINRVAKALGVHPSHLFTRATIEQRALDALQAMDDPGKREAAVIVLESMASRR